MVSLPIVDVSLLIFLNNNVLYEWILDFPISVCTVKSPVIVCVMVLCYNNLVYCIWILGGESDVVNW